MSDKNRGRWDHCKTMSTLMPSFSIFWHKIIAHGMKKNGHFLIIWSNLNLPQPGVPYLNWLEIKPWTTVFDIVTTKKATFLKNQINLAIWCVMLSEAFTSVLEILNIIYTALRRRNFFFSNNYQSSWDHLKSISAWDIWQLSSVFFTYLCIDSVCNQVTG